MSWSMVMVISYQLPVMRYDEIEIEMFFFPKAAAKGSFKKSAVIKHCYQTLPRKFC